MNSELQKAAEKEARLHFHPEHSKDAFTACVLTYIAGWKESQQEWGESKTDFETMKFPDIKGSDIHERTEAQELDEISTWLKNYKEPTDFNLWQEVAKEFHFDKPFYQTVVKGIVERLKNKGFMLSTCPLPAVVKSADEILDTMNEVMPFRSINDQQRPYVKEAIEMYHNQFKAVSAPDKGGGKWISVEDGLPEPNQKVICYNEGIFLTFLKYWPAGFKGNDVDVFIGIDDKGPYEKSEITHWQKLPSPPTT